MRILFYLPVVTPWWFDNIVAPLIRKCAAGADVHVVAAPLWRNTGIGADQVSALADLPDIAWHIWNGDDPAVFRLSAADDPALMELIQAIAADITLCRSADLEAPARFPGLVRYMMEAGAAPLPTASDWIVLNEQPFHSGAMPDLEPAARARLDALFAPVWEEMVARHAVHDAADASAWRVAENIPADARVLALPLEYAHEENFFRRFGRMKTAAALIADIAGRLPDGWVLAVSNHPLNVLHVDNTPLHAAIAAHGDKVRLVGDRGIAGGATTTLAAQCDGMVIEQSKSFVAAAFHRVPLQRSSRFATAPWLHAEADLDGFLARIDAGDAARPDTAGLRTWLGYHVVNDVINPDHPDLDFAGLVDRVMRPCDPARWEAGMAHYQRNRPDLDRPDETVSTEQARQFQLFRQAMGRR